MKERLKVFEKFKSSDNYRIKKRTLIPPVLRKGKVKFFKSFDEIFKLYQIQDGMTLSFHHHLRNGDYVMNLVSEEILKRNLKNLTFAPSSIFPNNEILSTLIINKNITNIRTNYLSGPVSKTIQSGKLDGLLLMDTHGGRSRAIESGEITIDVAFLATPTVDKLGNGYGGIGKSSCGTLGYAISDLMFAKKVVLVTDNLVDLLDNPDFDEKYVDGVLIIDSIGDKEGIVSGTTKITRDPIGLLIARKTALIIDKLGFIKNGFSVQTGAGGTSLAVASYLKEMMVRNNVTGSFASGGITSYFVEMLNDGLFEKLYDVQCFDLDAVKSYHENPNHLAMSASKYANPFDDPIVDKLDVVILGATEVDLKFNVNVTTDSFGNIIGGSGGHADTAHGAKVTIIVANLLRSRISLIKEKVLTVTTPGEDIDIIVTERGVAVNPNRKDIIKKLKEENIELMTINELYNLAIEIAGKPRKIKIRDNKVIGAVIYRDGSLIDYLYEK
ncbi:MAG: citrate lyase subunit alpha [Acholeplasmataceae bacterium]|jgi:citrate lyase subunit alpha/citrate CoA-transferase